MKAQQVSANSQPHYTRHSHYEQQQKGLHKQQVLQNGYGKHGQATHLLCHNTATATGTQQQQQWLMNNISDLNKHADSFTDTHTQYASQWR